LDHPFRVQPVLDDQHRFFWTAGADGELRLLRCQRCGYYLHPPLPRCPDCGSRDVAPEAVSGRGEVYSYTVNHQSWDGGTEPYVIVLVTIPEQEGLRLTSNLCGCAPDDVRIGMPVRVVFEQHGEVWFPLWEPVPEGER
jgi:uncharacterized OB-fold protein